MLEYIYSKGYIWYSVYTVVYTYIWRRYTHERIHIKEYTYEGTYTVVYTYDGSYIWRGYIYGGTNTLKRYISNIQRAIHTKGLIERGYTQGRTNIQRKIYMEEAYIWGRHIYEGTNI